MGVGEHKEKSTTVQTRFVSPLPLSLSLSRKIGEDAEKNTQRRSNLCGWEDVNVISIQ